ncbi:MAG: dimethylargininase [Frankia sp.]
MTVPTQVRPDTSPAPTRQATRQRYLMCPPTYFAVTYAINPWMDPSRPVDVDRAVRQWDALRQVHLDLGHTVEIIDPEPGLPDMVFAANGGVVIGDTAVGVKFRYPQRRGEQEAYLNWFAAAGISQRHQPSFDNEGEGDILLAGNVMLAGTGFRTDLRAHAELAALLGREVITLELIDPRFYHLDTALAVLDDTTVAYLPAAFSPASRAELARRFPDAIIATAADAEAFGLNAVSDGRNVVLAAEAVGLADQLRRRGFVPVPVAMDELRRAGGSAKCATLVLHP